MLEDNLPAGLSESQIPGCRPIDHAIDKAVEAKKCVACESYYTGAGCDDCGDSKSYFEEIDDLQEFKDRLKEERERRME